VSSPPDDESPQSNFLIGGQRLLKFEPDDTKRLFRQHRSKASFWPCADHFRSTLINRHARCRSACLKGATNGSDGLSFCIFCAPVTPLAGTIGAQDGWQCSHDRRPRYRPPRARSRRYSECAPAATKVVAARDLCSSDGRAHGEADLFSSDRAFTLRVSAATRT
jgi:hypothetical protein